MKKLVWIIIFLLVHPGSCTEIIRVRVVDGSSPLDGRLEVYYDGVWGTVCDDLFDDNDAKVFCNMAGLGVDGLTIDSAQVVDGSRQIWLDNVVCDGTEKHINDCHHAPWGIHNCHHGEDVGIRCGSRDEILVRVRDGLDDNEGRVEVSYFGVWGTVCDDDFDNRDAAVLCRMANLGTGGVALYLEDVVDGQDTIWLDEVNCQGYEKTIKDCGHEHWGSHDCSHYEDAGIRCTNDSSTSEITTSGTPQSGVRLREGDGPLSGRVEVYYSGVWGTVCDDLFDNNAAKVLCVMSGLGTDGMTIDSTQVVDGNGQIWLDNVDCDGTETHIDDCDHAPWGVHNCHHGEDAGVICGTGGEETRVRVRDGADSTQGRVEVYFFGSWGTVCDDRFDDDDAVVFCHMANLGTQGRALYGSDVVDGNGTIWLDEVNCKSEATDIKECSHLPWGRHNCAHSEDVGIQCYNGSFTIVPPIYATYETERDRVRVVDGTSPYDGRLEVLYGGVWGTVCDDLFDNNAAKVFCNITGLGTDGIALFDVAPGSGKIWLDNVQCNGTETTIDQCDHHRWGDHDCHHGEDVGIRCGQEGEEIRVRVRDGADDNEGRVEVYLLGAWGTVCDDGFDDNDAAVFCRMANLGTDGIALFREDVQDGTGSIYLDQVECQGDEIHIEKCNHEPRGRHDCAHNEDVGIRCTNGSATTELPPPVTTSSSLENIPVRIHNTSSHPHGGRVEVYYNGVWGTVCDDLFDNKDAKVLCNMGGLGTDGIALYGAQVEPGSGQIWLDEVDCDGSETHIEQCDHAEWGNTDCHHGEDAGIICGTGEAETRVRVRDGYDASEGRLEVYYFGFWGTVCDDNFDNNDAAVFCRMANLGTNGTALYLGDVVDGQGTIWLDEVQCLGNETDIEECDHAPWGRHDCGHYEDAGIRCYYH